VIAMLTARCCISHTSGCSSLEFRHNYVASMETCT